MHLSEYYCIFVVKRYDMSTDVFFIGREQERKRMQELLKFKGSSLVTVLGRRRVGKTYFVKQALKEVSYFHFTGIQGESKAVVLSLFADKINELNNSRLPIAVPSNWHEAFGLLKSLLQEKFIGNKKKVVFLDEFPWLDTHASGFLSAFEYFWNDWAVDQNILVIICGSSTSWMIKNVVKNRAGLHNRVNEYFSIQPFTLKETELYLKKKNIEWSRYDIVQIYMAIGGVPHYLNMIKRGESVPICIDRLFFDKNGPLRIEYSNLYRALFNYYDNYELVIDHLAKKRKGLTRQEIIETTDLPNGGGLTKILNELEECGFIQFQMPFSKKQKDGLYRLMDEYSMFYHHFITKNSTKGQFISIYSTAKVRSWMGISFESLCMKNEAKIKQALGIAGVYTELFSYTYQGRNKEAGFQIDMIIDRDDRIIELCEMKFYNGVISLTQKDAEVIRERKARFQTHTGTKKNVLVLLVSPFGLAENKHSLSIIDHEIRINDLF